ncbi:MAG: type II toxin-antitoxin system RelB/DinJ family antitoxin [Patescibacteria group bacterium]|mgnify:FL=1
MTTTVQIRIDPKMKKAANKALQAMGLDMSTGVKLFLAQVVRTNSIPFPVMSADFLPEEKKAELVREAKEALKGKGYRTARELHDAIA